MTETPKSKTYRRPASPQETERRKDWGKKWGKLVSEAVAKAIGEAGK